MIPSWITHSSAFCLGAATSAIGILYNHKLSRSSTSVVGGAISDNKNDDDTVSQPSSTGSPLISSLKMTPSLPIRFFQPNDNLLIAFDTRTRNPAYVLERLTNQRSTSHEIDFDQSQGTAASRKNKRFYEESNLPPHHRSQNHHFRNSGYDRGHLAPAADFAHDDNCIHDTFVLTNVSPQFPKFNRSLWLRLEEFVRSVAQKEFDLSKNDDDTNAKGTAKETEIWVVTGPLWLPNSVTTNASGKEQFRFSFEGIGKLPSLVSVPTHFFKVVVVVTTNSGQRPTKSNNSANSDTLDTGQEAFNESKLALKGFAAFVLPNFEIDKMSMKEANEVQLVNYIVRLTDLEAVSGLEFFPFLMGTYSEEDKIPPQKEIADALTDDVRILANRSKRERSVTLSSLSGKEALSKGRQRKVGQILRKNFPSEFQHLCTNNDACFKTRKI